MSSIVAVGSKLSLPKETSPFCKLNHAPDRTRTGLQPALHADRVAALRAAARTTPLSGVSLAALGAVLTALDARSSPSRSTSSPRQKKLPARRPRSGAPNSAAKLKWPFPTGSVVATTEPLLCLYRSQTSKLILIDRSAKCHRKCAPRSCKKDNSFWE